MPSKEELKQELLAKREKYLQQPETETQGTNEKPWEEEGRTTDRVLYALLSAVGKNTGIVGFLLIPIGWLLKGVAIGLDWSREDIRYAFSADQE